MSGSGANLPITVGLEGIEQVNRQIRELAEEMKRPVQAAEAIGPAVSRAGESFGQLERRTVQAAGAVRDLRGAMELLGAGGAAGMLGPVASGIGNLADAFGVAEIAAGKFGAASQIVMRLLPPLAIATVAVVAATTDWDAAAAKLRTTLQNLRGVTYDNEQATASYARGIDIFVASIESAVAAERRLAQATRDRQIAAMNVESLALRSQLTPAQRRLAELEPTAEQVRLAREIGGADTVLPSAIQRRYAEYQTVQADVRRMQEDVAALDGAMRDLQSIPFGTGSIPRPGAPPATGGGGRAASAPRERPMVGDGMVDAFWRAQSQTEAARVRDEEQHLRRIEQANERTTDSIVRYAGDAFADMFKETGGGFEALMARMQQAGVQTFARIAAEAVIRPIVAPIVSDLGLGGITGGGSGGLGGITGGGSGGLGSMLGLSNLLPTGGLVSGLNSAAAGLFPSIFTSTGSANIAGALPSVYTGGAFPAAGGTAMGTSLSGVLGAAGLGFMGGSMLAGLTGGNSTGGGIGGALGAGLGMLTPLGPLGAILGGAAGGLLGGMFGGGEGTSAYHIAVGTYDGRFGLVDSAQKNAEEEYTAAMAATQQQIAALNQMLAANNLWASGIAPIGRDSAAPDRAPTLAEAFGSFRFGGGSETLNATLANRSIGSADELAGITSFVATYEAMIAIGKPVDAFAEQLKAINAQFDAAAVKARELGLSEYELQYARERAISAAEGARRDAAAASLVGPIGGLGAFVSGLRVSNDNPLSPFARRDAARDQFETAAQRAAAGDLAALSQVQSGAQAFLAASRDVNGSGTGYVQDFQSVLGRLDAIAGTSAETLTAQTIQAETRTQTEILNATLLSVRSEIASLRAEVAQGSRMPGRLAA
jgi:hypothetical protein